MEFKKNPRYHKGSLKPDSPPRDSSARPASLSVHRPSADPRHITPTPHTSPLSYVRTILGSKKSIVISLAIVAASGILITGLITHRQNTDQKLPADNPAVITESFKKETIVPEGKSVEQLGGWKRVSPPTSDPVFAYTDTLDGIAITVSQQILPESFKTSTDSKVADLAEKFSATTKITAGKTTAYLGSSSKGPQSVIFTKDNVLILIKSQKKISDGSWAKYIESLS